MSDRMTLPVTLQHVADKAGVSAKTVSRVVNGDPHVSGRTRERVSRAIAALGYRPNLAARALATARSYMVGVISPYLRGFYYSELHASAQSSSRTRGYHLLIEEYVRGGQRELAELEDSLRSTRVEGVLLTPTVSDDTEVLDLVERLGLRCVRISPGTELNRMDAVSADQAQGMTELADHFVALGHRRFGIVESPKAMLGENRHELLAGALIRRGIDPADIRIEALDWQGSVTGAARAVAARFLSARPRPTAIFTANDYVAMPIIQFAFEQGLRVPHDISVAGCDDIDIAAVAWPSLTTIHQPIATMAAEGMGLLLSPKPNFTRHLTLPMPLVVRGSTASCTA
jgi:LacI family transcriptional regulator